MKYLFLIIMPLAFIYMLPSFLAYFVKAKKRKYILIMNVLLGWTGIGWLASFFWIIYGEYHKDKVITIRIENQVVEDGVESSK